jgi:hypothetical protein
MDSNEAKERELELIQQLLNVLEKALANLRGGVRDEQPHPTESQETEST